MEKGEGRKHSTSSDSWPPDMPDEAVFTVLLLTRTGASGLEFPA